jgi:hypothetical protein
MRTRTGAWRDVARAASLVAALGAGACGPGEPKRLPRDRGLDGSAAASPEAAPVLAENPAVTVTHADGSPFPGCKVSAFEPSSHQRIAGGTTDEAGVVHFDGIDTKRRYELYVEPPMDRADAYEAIRTHAWPPSDTAVALPALLTVEGSVTTADGGPARGAAVRCTHAKGAVSVTVGSDGRFVVRRVPEGAVQLAVAASWADAERGKCGPPTAAKAGDRGVELTAR